MSLEAIQKVITMGFKLGNKFGSLKGEKIEKITRSKFFVPKVGREMSTPFMGKKFRELDHSFGEKNRIVLGKGLGFPAIARGIMSFDELGDKFIHKFSPGRR
jgi:hypothetical protein